MKMRKQGQRVKGFTIVEMVTVMAIIGVLLGVLAPTMSAYYQRSRLRSANAYAKMVYNAAQTEAQKFIARDRTSSEASVFSGICKVVYAPGSDAELKNNTLAPATADEDAKTLGANVNRAVSGAADVCWAVYIDNYIVKASVSADNPNTNYVGYYTKGKIDAEAQTTPYSSCYESLLDEKKGVYDTP